jgi:adenosylhomocysteine nucleosidase
VSSGHLLVVSPMPEEGQALAAAFRPVRPRHPLVSLAEGEIAGLPVVSAITGIGKAATAAGVQLALDRYPVRGAVLVGVGGAVADGVPPGSVMVTSRAVQWDVDARPMTDRPGLVPGRRSEYEEADPALIELAATASVAAGAGPVRRGTALAGDSIIASAARRDTIAALYPDAVCFDMETAAFGVVAAGNSVPWVGVRVISDSADEGVDVAAIIHFAAHHAGEVLASIVRRMCEAMVEAAP